MATILTNAQTSFDFMRAAFGTLPEPCPHTVHLAGVPGAPARPDLLIVDEPFGAPENLALLQTRSAATWTLVRIREAITDIKQLEECSKIADYFNDRCLVMLVDAGQLQHPGSPLSFGGTWEKTARGLVYEIADFPNMHYATHFIAAVGLSGALSFTRVVEDRLRDADKPWQRRLYYYPREVPTLCESQDAAVGGQILLAVIALEWLRSPARDSVSQGVCLGLEAARNWRDRGRDGSALQQAAQIVADGHAEEPNKRTAPPYLVSLPEWWEPQELRESWTVLQWRYRTDQDALRLALRIVREGADAALGDVPTLRMDHLITPDPKEIEALSALRARISKYISTATQRRPLNIGVFGPPGAGKSFGVKSIAAAMTPQLAAANLVIDERTFNLTNFNGPADLTGAFRTIVETQADGILPIVFWDEFDRQLNGRDLGWLESFLVPTWDGHFIDNGRAKSFGKIIFVFAGGTAHSYKDFEAQVGLQPAATKAQDFLTRLTFNLDIPSLDYSDNFSLIRRALILRSLFERLAPHFLSPGRVLDIDPSVAGALLRVPGYNFGARSLETLVTSSRPMHGASFGQAELPADDILSVHVNIHEFRRLLDEPPNTSTDLPFSATFMGWPLTPDDRDYVAYHKRQRERGGL